MNTGRISTKNTFETFKNIDPNKTKLSEIIDSLKKKRDFSESAVHLMLKQQGISTNKLISFKIQILLYPPQRDFDTTIPPVYDSDLPGS